jgi:hypothetical protein
VTGVPRVVVTNMSGAGVLRVSAVVGLRVPGVPRVVVTNMSGAGVLRVPRLVVLRVSRLVVLDVPGVVVLDVPGAAVVAVVVVRDLARSVEGDGVPLLVLVHIGCNSTPRGYIPQSWAACVRIPSGIS